MSLCRLAAEIIYTLLKKYIRNFFIFNLIYNIKGIKIKINNTIPLTQLKPNQTAQIVAINKGCKCQTRLADMGLRIGSQIEAIQNAGPILIAIGPMRLGIGQGIANHIMVELT